uniref:Uncharacterized protein n=1 Tax=Anguilla anguilla TaxID=7936 RepID=A0A0E9S2V0_ANGAN
MVLSATVTRQANQSLAQSTLLSLSSSVSLFILFKSLIV